MEWTSKIELKPEEARLLVAEAMTARGFTVTADDVTFKTGMHYGQMDRGPGSPMFTGITITTRVNAGKSGPGGS